MKEPRANCESSPYITVPCVYCIKGLCEWREPFLKLIKGKNVKS